MNESLAMGMPCSSSLRTISESDRPASFTGTATEWSNVVGSPAPGKAATARLARSISSPSVPSGRATVTTSPPTAALSSSGLPETTIFPWSMMASRLHSRSASSMYWVVRKIVVPPARSSSRCRHSALRVCGSSPVVGSSRNRSGGSWTSAWTRSRRRRIPPEYAPARLLAASVSPNIASRRSARRRASARLIPCSRPWRIRFSRPVRSTSIPMNWPE